MLEACHWPRCEQVGLVTYGDYPLCCNHWQRVCDSDVPSKRTTGIPNDIYREVVAMAKETAVLA